MFLGFYYFGLERARADAGKLQRKTWGGGGGGEEIKIAILVDFDFLAVILSF